MARIASGAFSTRDSQTRELISAVTDNILSDDRYLRIETGIEHRFGKHAGEVHRTLYNSMGPTTDLLRYFPDSLCFDRHRSLPTWEPDLANPHELPSNTDQEATGLFSFFVEYKYSGTKRSTDIGDVPSEWVGILEREAWLTYKRLTSPNPQIGTYLDGMRTRIALFYAAEYTPERIHAGWEELVVPIHVRREIARPGEKTIPTQGSGTPWINFDIRKLKPLERFLVQDLHWEESDAVDSVQKCRRQLFPEDAIS